MKRWLFTISLLLAARVGAYDAALQPAIDALNGKAAAPADYEATCRQVLDGLYGEFSNDDSRAKGAADQAWHAICMRSIRPGAEAERAAVAKVMLAKVTAGGPTWSRVWLLKQLQWLARDEAVTTLAGLLTDADAYVRQHALLALQASPAPAATGALVKALGAATEPAQQIALVAALGFRRDPAATAALAGHLTTTDPALLLAPATALGNLGSAAALDALVAREKTADATARRTFEDAIARCAERLVAAGDQARAAQAYELLWAANRDPRTRLAGLRGLVLARGEAAVPLILEVMGGPDPLLQATAAQLAVDVPGTAATAAFGQRLPNLPPAVQMALLGALADRGDKAAGEAVTAATAAADEGVRLAAIRALATLGDARAVPMLARLAAEGQGPARGAARDALARLLDPGVEPAIVAALPTAPLPQQRELVQALVARRAQATVPALLSLAATGAPEVRSAAYRAIGALASPADLPKLLDLLLGAPTDDEGTAAEEAVVAVLPRAATADERAQPLLARLAGATGGGRLALLRCLGTTGADQALTALSAALRDGDPAVRAAALVALESWPDARPAPAVLAATTAAPAGQRLEALKTYVKLVGLDEARPSAARLADLRAALDLATTQPEKRAVAAGLGGVAIAEAVPVLVTLLPDAQAASSLVAVGWAVAMSDRTAARTAAEQVLAQTQDEGLKGRANELLQMVQKLEDYVTDWHVAGPYTGGGTAELFAKAFAPEDANAKDAKWQRLSGKIDTNQPFRINLDSMPIGGNNRCAYLRTRVWVPAAVEAEGQLGSDDGAKVWLNGAVVHANGADRAHSPGADKFRVALKEGWNDVLVKVVQGGGEWALSLRFRTADNQPIQDLKFQAAP